MLMAREGDLPPRKDEEDSNQPVLQSYTLSDQCHIVINQGDLLTQTQSSILYHKIPEGQS